MKYVGSKAKYAKEILPIILKDRELNQYYIEPFVGGFNTIDKVGGLRIANDSNFYLIELFKAIQKGWTPPDFVSEDEYNNIRLNKDKFSPYLVAFVGFGCSYSGKWFGGYARGNSNKGVPRNYCLESKKNILKQKEGLEGIVIENKNYLDLEIPANSIIYCDPPYLNTVKYKDSINYDEFWNWIRELFKKGHKVYISEYSAPEDFSCLWEKEVYNTLDKNTGAKKGIEKLFTLKK
jgi:DNA adenine methylase